MKYPDFSLVSEKFFETNIGGATIRVQSISVEGRGVRIKVHPSDIEYFLLWQRNRVTKKYLDTSGLTPQLGGGISFLSGATPTSYEAPEEREVMISAMGHVHIAMLAVGGVDLSSNMITLSGSATTRWPGTLN